MDPTANIATSPAAVTPGGAAGKPGIATAAGGASDASASTLGAGFAALLAALGLGVEPTAAAGEGEGVADPNIDDVQALLDDLELTAASEADAAAIAAALAAAGVVTPPPATAAGPTPTGDALVTTVGDPTAGSGSGQVPDTGLAAPGVAGQVTPPPAETEAVGPESPVVAQLAAQPQSGASAEAASGPAVSSPEDPLPSARVSSLGEKPDARGSKVAADQDVDAVAARARVDDAPTAVQSNGADLEFGAGQQGTGEGRQVEVTQAIATRDTGLGHGLDRVSAPAVPTVRDAAPATVAAPAPLRDVEEFLSLSSLRGAGVMREGSEMRLHVSPEGLGNVEVRVTVRQDGVHASLVAEQDQARHALQANRSSLESALGRSSLRLDGFTVDLGFHHSHQQQGDGRQGQSTPAQVFSRWFGPDSSPAIPEVGAALASHASAAGALSVRA